MVFIVDKIFVSISWLFHFNQNGIAALGVGAERLPLSGIVCSNFNKYYLRSHGDRSSSSRSKKGESRLQVVNVLYLHFIVCSTKAEWVPFDKLFGDSCRAERKEKSSIL